ncbi:MAG TPA: hypothetical protein VKF32_02235, partial [Thermoanaerobaculia bacterium]|nr:hypothetical protein [Thermoanaerobaculia bacterium]
MRRARKAPVEGWGARWARLVADFGWKPGRHETVPSARVRELEIETSGISATVREGRDRLAEPHIALEPFPDDVREKAVEALARKASFVASLLAGRLPEDADDALAATGWTLLPASPREIHQSCTCGEGPSPCRHLLALHAVLEERLSRDPFLLFTLRGIDKETL